MKLTQNQLRKIIRETLYHTMERGPNGRKVDFYKTAVFKAIDILVELDEDVYDEWHTVEKDVRKLCRGMRQPFDKVWPEALETFGIEL